MYTYLSLVMGQNYSHSDRYFEYACAIKLFLGCQLLFSLWRGWSVFLTYTEFCFAVPSLILVTYVWRQELHHGGGHYGRLLSHQGLEG